MVAMPSTVCRRRASQAPKTGAAWTRRAILSGAGLTAAMWGLPGRATLAQSLSGEIRVGYEGSNATAAPVIEATAQALEEANPGVAIELEPSAAGSYATQLVLQLSGGQAPDVFLLSGVALAELATSGLISPLDTYLDAWEGWAEHPDVVRTMITYEGSVWAIPYPIDTHFLYYRKDLFEQAGLPREWQPEHPDDILEAAGAIRDALPDVIPYALYAGANGGNGTVARGFIPLVYAYGGWLTDEAGLWVIDSCPIREALGFYERAYQIEEVVPQDVMTAASPSQAMRDAMGSGELGILYEGCWVYQPWLDEDPEDTVENIGFALFPTADGRPPFAIGGAGNSWYINAASENQDLAWAFIAAFNSVEHQVAMNLADPHIPARTDAAADPAFQETDFLRAMVDSISSLVVASPDPAFRQLITIVQNATGLVATGEASPAESLERYASELTRVLGEDQVVAQPCP
jgi:multiple sugar transport system substrate-binding protein